MASVYFDPAVGGDGSTVTDDSNPTTGLANGGHRTRYVPSLANIVSVGNFALTKATAAAASATTANAWAVQLGTPVSGGEYSAKYHAQAAASSATSAASSATAAISSFDAFDDRYLGDKSSDPATDNDGNALLTGAMYWRTTAPAGLKVWNGSAWVAAALSSVSASGIGVTPTGPLTDTDAQSALSTLSGGKLVFQGRSARASNTALAAADCGKLIDITGGTFTQTLTASATLGANWYCYLRNSGTGDITLDPNGSEQIDGLTSYVMYPNETRLVTCNGAGFFTIVLTGYYRTFTSSAIWTKPPGYAAHSGLLWGGGGGGCVDGGTYVAGAGGGSCLSFTAQSTTLAASVTVTIGAGGVGSTNAGAGGNGGNSQFATFLAYGGGGAGASGGSGGGLLSAGGSVAVSSYVSGGLPASAGTSTKIHNEGGGGGAGTADYTSNAVAGSSVWGGAGGGCSGGSSVWGGGGGGGTTPPTMAGTGGVSLYGGNGGAGCYGAGTAGSGAAPGGGGGSVGSSVTGQAGAGARGELRIWGVI